MTLINIRKNLAELMKDLENKLFLEYGDKKSIQATVLYKFEKNRENMGKDKLIIELDHCNRRNTKEEYTLIFTTDTFNLNSEESLNEMIFELHEMMKKDTIEEAEKYFYENYKKKLTGPNISLYSEFDINKGELS